MKTFRLIFLFLVFISPVFSFAQDYTVQLNNGGSITFPYQINFTQGELNLLKSLDSLTLQKIAQIANQLKSKTNQNNSQVTNSQINTTTNSGQTTYSNTQSAKTPYYNPTTRQYQSTPVTQSQQTLFSNQQTSQTPYYNPQTGQYQSTPSQSSGGFDTSGFGTGNNSTGNNFLNQSTPQTQGTVISNLFQGIAKGLKDESSSSKSYTGSCGGYSSDADMRAAFKQAGIEVKQNSASYDQMPSFVPIFLKKIKDECNCTITLTAGTETAGHASHGPKKAIFDLRSQEPFNTYVNSKGRNIDGVTFLYETAGMFAQTTATHWHVNANGYKCSL